MKLLPLPRRTDRFGTHSNMLIVNGALILFLIILAVTLLLYFVTQNTLALLAGGAACAVSIVIAPQLFRKGYDLFEPLSFIVFTTLMGTFLRTLYIIFVEDENTRVYLMLGRPPEFLLPAMLLILFAMTFFTVGYSFPIRAIPLERFNLLSAERWNWRRLVLILLLLSGVAVVAMALYSQRLGLSITSLSDISAKRRLVVEGADFEFAALGYYLWGADLITYAFFLLFAVFATSKRPFFSALGFFSVLLGVLAVIFPIITSSRTEVLLPIIYALMMWHYLRQRIPPWVLVAMIGLVLSFLILLGSLRAINQGNSSSISDYLGLEALLGSRHWLDITKTAHIVDAIPEMLDFEYGKTLFSWVIAPVPRTVWPEKPVIRSGQTIGQTVYAGQFVKTGVPPGFIAELYWNFGFLGVAMGMFYLGLGLKALYMSFRDYLSKSRNALLIYMGIMLPFALALLGGDLSGTMIKVILSTVTLVIVLAFISRGKRYV
jgi:oligosaccharide repeat unit polymerase